MQNMTHLDILQFSACHSCTGVDFLGMITCSSVDDMIQPTWVASEGASTYMADAGMNIWDELCCLEQTCCAHKMSRWFTYLNVYRANNNLDLVEWAIAAHGMYKSIQV